MTKSVTILFSIELRSTATAATAGVTQGRSAATQRLDTV